MKKAILASMFVLPLFFYLFLRFFTTNHFSIPIYYPQEELSAEGDTIYHQIPNFSFIDTDSNLVNQSIFANRITVVDFMFTRCPGPCPKMSSMLKQLQTIFSADTAIQILSISVDPDFDKVKVLKEYSERLGANTTKWRFVTGNKKEVQFISKENGFKLALSLDSIPENVNHSIKFVLVDSQKRIRGYYDGTSQKEFDRLVTEIRILKSNSEL